VAYQILTSAWSMSAFGGKALLYQLSYVGFGLGEQIYQLSCTGLYKILSG